MMGFDFMGHGSMSLNWGAWRSCFRLAEAFGWTPAGTLAPTLEGPPCQDWPGLYFTNDWQEVTDDDARSLGVALENALAARKTSLELTEEQTEALRDAPKSLVKKLAKYVARGGFLIG